MRRFKPIFLTLDEVLALHADQIARYGGRPGLRDLGLLESALAMPRATFGRLYLHPSLPEMAAAYLFHLAGNHPFLDGNKRVGLAAAIAFLGLNGLWLEADPDELAELVLRTARGEAGKAEVAEFIRERMVEA
ncbi:MAG TPA: type II toxin-antitoxin system death-on-curing family toxin [Myxococcaceae bacterium]|nr:type II toxin-antitoxin system death-on-curing family toxin [Myxococcaceae bacterium]